MGAGPGVATTLVRPAGTSPTADPEPVTLKSGALSFVAAFLAFIAIGQIGLWATGGLMGSSPSLRSWPRSCPSCTRWSGWSWLTSHRAAGYAALALAFVAALVVGGQGPEGLLQFATVGIIALLVVVYLGNRRESAARR